MSTSGQIQSNLITVSSIHANTDLTLIQITEDKLRLVLLEHISKLETKRRWQVPFGVLLTLIPIFLTSEFKDFADINKSTWQAFFMFASVSSAAWLLVSLRWIFSSTTLDNLVERVKNVAK